MTDWHGCYDSSWKGLIVDEAFAHPAKFSHGLIERIVEHGLEKGYWKAGDLIGDPFGGVGLGGILCASRGLRWLGCELEKRFVKLANENFALHYTTWQTFGDPQPEIVQGDSRRFAEIVGEVCGAITSPPYADARGTPSLGTVNKDAWGQDGRDIVARRGLSADYGTTPGQIGSLPAGELDGAITSPPYAEQMTDESGNRIDYSQAREGGKKRTKAREAFGKSFGSTDGQIGSLPAGQVDGAITSPPYAEGQGHGGTPTPTPHDTQGTADAMQEGYGVAEGQIGALKEGSLDGAVTSPPWEESLAGSETCEAPHDSKGTLKAQYKERPVGSGYQDVPSRKRLPDGTWPRQREPEYYSNIGRESGETYWQAMAAVYRQMWLAMKPGGVAAIVLKDYVKAGKRVPLCDDTCRLLESCGFEVFERTRCWLVKETVERGLFGDVTTRREKKSFFRRLAEKKGSPRIDWEMVIWARRVPLEPTRRRSVAPET